MLSAPSKDRPGSGRRRVETEQTEKKLPPISTSSLPSHQLPLGGRTSPLPPTRKRSEHTISLDIKPLIELSSVGASNFVGLQDPSPSAIAKNGESELHNPEASMPVTSHALISSAEVKVSKPNFVGIAETSTSSQASPQPLDVAVENLNTTDQPSSDEPKPPQSPISGDKENGSDTEDGDSEDDNVSKHTEYIKQAIAALKEENADYTDKTIREHLAVLYKYNKGRNREMRLRNALTVLNEGYIDDVYAKMLKIVEDGKYYEEEAEGRLTVQLNFQKAMLVVWNTTDACSEICQRVIDSGVMSRHMALLRSEVFAPEVLKGSKNKTYVVKGLLGILFNICTRLDVRDVMREAGAVDVLQIFLRSKFLMVKTKAVMTLSHIITEEENDMVNASDMNIKFIVSILESALSFKSHFTGRYGFAVNEVLLGLNKIAINDANKVTIVKSGALPLYVRCLKGSEDERLLAARGLWTLSFSPENKQLIRDEPGCIDGLKELLGDSNDKIQAAAKGALWVLGEQETTKDVVESASHENVQHVMISYQWDSQKTMLWVKDKLKEAGYKVWMDVEQMEGSILEAMANAVENAAVVIVCMSQKYMDSPNCRTEGEYTFRLRKDVVPLLLQKDFRPSGWLGAMIGNKLYFDFSQQCDWTTKLQDVIRELRHRGKLGVIEEDTTDSEFVSSTTVSVPPPSMPVISVLDSWTHEDVMEWLAKLDLQHHSHKFANFDGKLVHGLVRMRHTSPDFYYKVMKEELHLGLVDLLKFTNSLERLT